MTRTKNCFEDYPEFSGIEYMGDVEVFDHVPRGLVLAGVLDGTMASKTIAVITDGDSGSLDSPIPYDPNTDARLDKFDGLEEGYKYIDRFDLADSEASKDSSEEK